MIASGEIYLAAAAGFFIGAAVVIALKEEQVRIAWWQGYRQAMKDHRERHQFLPYGTSKEYSHSDN